MKQVRALGLILFALVIVVVVVQNFEAMSTSVRFRVNFLFFKHETPEISLYLLSVVFFLLGVVVMGLYGISERFSMKRQMKALRKEALEKDRELRALRNLPVTADDVSPITAQGEQ